MNKKNDFKTMEIIFVEHKKPLYIRVLKILKKKLKNSFNNQSKQYQ